MRTLIETDTLSVSTTLQNTPAPLRGAGVPFVELKREILGSDYELSVLYTGDTLSKRLNTRYRNKKYPTNVLSFPLSDTSGELFLNVRKAERELKEWGRTLKSHTGILVVHGMLHLAGYDHGDAMENEETRIGKKFGFL